MGGIWALSFCTGGETGVVSPPQWMQRGRAPGHIWTMPDQGTVRGGEGPSQPGRTPASSSLPSASQPLRRYGSHSVPYRAGCSPFCSLPRLVEKLAREARDVIQWPFRTASARTASDRRAVSGRTGLAWSVTRGSLFFTQKASQQQQEAASPTSLATLDDALNARARCLSALPR
ncbi:hypothetical protein B0T16DRAFT_384745 [Cercophora newfieldiana]|uniref:Uncharacterized protein n=1 Tax=Cercophora newfieldiana TaxID=92897 RepID=A0AA39YQ24_9PEZI|nr:hypothetical protein B0T16DRAFT_384745 [Cercophora newfieldiana]